MEPTTYRRVTLFALIALAVIVVTGAAVRLTGSGLGCSDWPNCEQDRFVGEMTSHTAIEQGNRWFTGVVAAAVVAAVAGSLWRRPRRPDLTRWSLGLVAGVLGQIVLGGIVVKSDLNPWLVLGHFQLSMVLVWNAVVLHDRAGRPDDDHTWTAPRTPATRLARAIAVLTVATIFVGTLVTGSGPHTGSRDEPIDRLPFAVRDITRVHSIVAIALVVAIVAAVLQARRHGPADLRRHALVVLGLVLAQGAIGYAQYFTGVPVLLVGFHIAGATALWIGVVSFTLRALRPVDPVVYRPAREPLGSPA